MPDTIIGLINNSFDKIILNSFLGLSSLGLYDIANRFSNVYKQVLDLNNSYLDTLFYEQI